MNKLKNQNGITLIALVITIIVMLILVAVTITMAVNGGLFDYARRAGQETNRAIEQEQQLANLESNLTVDQLIEKYSGITASTVKADPEKYYGATVTNYEWPNQENEDVTWRIFHSDGENIYLIASDYVASVPDGANGSEVYSDGEDYPYYFFLDNVINDYGLNEEGKYLVKSTNPAKKWIEHYLDSEYDNMKIVAYMLDTEQWGGLYTGEKAKYAIGVPTLKMFTDSYKTTHTKQILYRQTEDDNNYGYEVGLSKDNYNVELDELGSEALSIDNLYIITKNIDDNGRADSMWIAAPSADSDSVILHINYSGSLSYECFDAGGLGFRPIVCLNNNVALEAVEDGENITYKIK